MEHFINFGLYSELDAKRLKEALENYEVPVNMVSSGTTIGRESTAQAGVFAYTLFIPRSKVESAEKIREELHIVRFDTFHSVRSPYDNINRYLFIISFLSFFLVWLGILFDQLFQSIHAFFINNTNGVSFAVYGLMSAGFLTFLSATALFIRRFFRRKFSSHAADQNNKNEMHQ